MNKWLNEWMIDWIDDIIDAEWEFIGCDKGLCCFVNHSTERIFRSFIHSMICWLIQSFNQPSKSKWIKSDYMNEYRIDWMNEWMNDILVTDLQIIGCE